MARTRKTRRNAAERRRSMQGQTYQTGWPDIEQLAKLRVRAARGDHPTRRLKSGDPNKAHGDGKGRSRRDGLKGKGRCRLSVHRKWTPAYAFGSKSAWGWPGYRPSTKSAKPRNAYEAETGPTKDDAVLCQRNGDFDARMANGVCRHMGNAPSCAACGDVQQIEKRPLAFDVASRGWSQAHGRHV